MLLFANEKLILVLAPSDPPHFVIVIPFLGARLPGISVA